MALATHVWDALGITSGIGYKTPIARPQIYNTDASASIAGLTGWRLLNGAWWFEHVLIQDDPPVYHDEWHRIFDYTVPTAAPLSPAIDYYPLDDTTYPKNAVAHWTSQSRPYTVNVSFYRSTNGGASYFFQEGGAGTDASPEVFSSAVYAAGDYGYVVMEYYSLDGNIAGPSSSSGIRIF